MNRWQIGKVCEKSIEYALQISSSDLSSLSNSTLKDIFWTSTRYMMTTNPPITNPAEPTEDGYRGGDWSLMSDVTEWNGRGLLELIHDGSKPFGNVWDVSHLLEEVETQFQARDMKSAATSKALLSQTSDIEITPHSSSQKSCSLVEQATPGNFRRHMALLDELPAGGVVTQDFPAAPLGKRDFCVTILKAKVEGLIGNQCDRIGWEEDKLTVGPLAPAAKQSLLRLIPLILPEGRRRRPVPACPPSRRLWPLQHSNRRRRGRRAQIGFSV